MLFHKFHYIIIEYMRNSYGLLCEKHTTRLKWLNDWCTIDVSMLHDFKMFY